MSDEKRTVPEQAHDKLISYINSLEIELSMGAIKGKAKTLLEGHVEHLRGNCADVLFSDMSNDYNVDWLIGFMNDIGEEHFARSLTVEEEVA